LSDVHGSLVKCQASL